MRVPLNSMDKTALLLMSELWQKENIKPKGTQNIKSILPKPDLNLIPSKGTAMSEEEFEEAIKALALKTAEKGTAMEDIGKAKEIFRAEENKLLYKYISVASPDRKAAYESTPTIDGNFNQKLMVYANGAWGTGLLTKEELSRGSKFYEIYQNTMKEYQAEHGQIPSKETRTSSSNPYSVVAYNPKAYTGLYNALA